MLSDQAYISRYKIDLSFWINFGIVNDVEATLHHVSLRFGFQSQPLQNVYSPNSSLLDYIHYFKDSRGSIWAPATGGLDSPLPCSTWLDPITEAPGCIYLEYLRFT